MPPSRAVRLSWFVTVSTLTCLIRIPILACIVFPCRIVPLLDMGLFYLLFVDCC